MIRILNFAFIAIAGLACLGLYRIAEQARITEADLKTAQAAIAREENTIAVLGAEWARLTQPARIEALAQRHLLLSDGPTFELSSFGQLPLRDAPIAPVPAFRNANAAAPETHPAPEADLTRAAYPGT